MSVEEASDRGREGLASTLEINTGCFSDCLVLSRFGAMGCVLPTGSAFAVPSPISKSAHAREEKNPKGCEAGTLSELIDAGPPAYVAHNRLRPDTGTRCPVGR